MRCAPNHASFQHRAGAVGRSFRTRLSGRGPARAALLLATALNLWAHGAVATTGSGEERHLDGHGFLPSFFVIDPFVDTRLETSVGAANAVGLETDLYDLDDTYITTVTGELVYATLALHYQARIGERFALGASISSQVRAGQSAYAFLAEGADVQTDFKAWGVWRVLRGIRDQVSVGIDWGYEGTILFTPEDFARDIADGGGFEDARLVEEQRIWTAHFRGSWAHAFSPAYGARLSGQFGAYEVPDASSTFKAHHRIGVLGEVDFKHLRGAFPLGITGGYTQNFAQSDPQTGLAGFILGFWYTGREDYSVGVELGLLKVPVRQPDTDEIDATSALLTMRYSF